MSAIRGYKQTVTRAMFTTILAKIDGADTSSYTEMSFTDVPAGQFYTAPVVWATETGITTGLTATTFGPTVNCNRAQVVTFLYRAAQIPEPEPEPLPFPDIT